MLGMEWGGYWKTTPLFGAGSSLLFLGLGRNVSGIGGTIPVAAGLLLTTGFLAGVGIIVHVKNLHLLGLFLCGGPLGDRTRRPPGYEPGALTS